MTRKKLIAGNWKMNGSTLENARLFHSIQQGLEELQAQNTLTTNVVLCAPFIYLAQLQSLLKSASITLGSQDISAYERGAFTGEISAMMLKEFGVRYSLCGHSERRQYHAESDQSIALKAKAALHHGITPIVCLGETLAERESGKTHEVIKRQLAAVVHENGHCISEVVLAYEPVWAIGTGQTATPEMAQEVHGLIRSQLRVASPVAAQRVPILYGGSMNASNAQSLLVQDDIDGGLIGGASLNEAHFLSIIQSANSAAALSTC